MNEAIKLAVKKGEYKLFPSYWNFKPVHATKNLIKFVDDKGNERFRSVPRVTQDPLFWQALGKALGYKVNQRDSVTNRLIWQQIALDYFELILTGGSTKKFWKDLLTQ